MTDQPLDDDLRALEEVDRLIDQRAHLLQRINRETPSSSDRFDRGPRGSGPRPAG